MDDTVTPGARSRDRECGRLEADREQLRHWNMGGDTREGRHVGMSQ